MKIAVIYGSVRTNRQGIKAAKFVKNQLEERKIDAKLVDPLDYNLPLLDKTFKEYGGGSAPKGLRELSNLLKSCDGFIVVSGEYNHSIPPALSNLLDHFMSEFFFKPSGIVTYSSGPFGGVRAAVHLRAFLGELGMPSIPTMFPISKVQDSFDESGKDLTSSYTRRIKKFLDEFEWYTKALSAARNVKTPY